MKGMVVKMTDEQLQTMQGDLDELRDLVDQLLELQHQLLDAVLCAGNALTALSKRNTGV